MNRLQEIRFIFTAGIQLNDRKVPDGYHSDLLLFIEL